MRAQVIKGTLEWASRNFNVCRGCTHNCWYCYAKSMAIRFGRMTSETWKTQIPLPDKLAEAGKGKPTRIMFPSTHDITPERLDICMDALDRMLKRGHTVLVVSKPHAQCITAICSRFVDYKDRLIFRFTIGSTDNNVLQAWEPDAPLFEERLLCLEMASAQGYQTSVSCEPMLDDAVERVVATTMPFVSDTVWIGVMNDVTQRLKLNGAPPEIRRMGADLRKTCNRDMIKNLHSRLKDNPKIRWKDSIKQMLDLDRPTKPGMNVLRKRDNMRTIFTIGTTDMHDEPFLRLLHEHNVDIVIDVRLRNEGPRYKFGAGAHIKHLAMTNRMAYAHDVSFAPTNEILRAWWRNKNWSAYVAGFNNLMIERDAVQVWRDRYNDFSRPCLLCMEKTPTHCHRRLLAERFAAELDMPIVHLRSKATT